MDWIKEFSLFLFDFDGLLVNTEYLHYQAYQKLVASYGFNLGWSFEKYCSIAHASAEGLRIEILAQFPQLRNKGSWDTLYKQKKDFYLEILHSSSIPLMPGVEDFLKRLHKEQKRCVVVTHSSLDLIESIRKQHRVLESIHDWITREDYADPKPSSQCYQLAIDRYADNKEKGIIGFEDSPRGMRALMGTTAVPMMVCDPQVVPSEWEVEPLNSISPDKPGENTIFHTTSFSNL